MKIPKKLKIQGHIYEVKFADGMDGAQGDIDEKKNLIRLELNQPQDQKEVSLIHEILGACNSTLHDKDHALLSSLAEQLYQVLHDNHLLR